MSIAHYLWPVTFLVLAGCSRGQDAPPGTGAPEKRADVRVQKISAEPLTETIPVLGIVKAVDEAVVSAEEGGVVQFWKKEKGQKVAKGEELVHLKDDILRPMYEAALAQYRTAELNFGKQQKVYEEQAVSEMAYKSAEYGRDAARAGADLAKARWEHTRITSPIDGTLDERFPKVGEMVGPGVPVARVVNLDQVKVLLSVPERYAGLLTVGAPVSFTVNAFPGKEFGGKTRFVSATVVADNRTIPVEVYLPNPGHLLKPEMIAKVKLVQSARRTAILLEEQLVRQVDQDRYVAYIVQDNRAMQRAVKLGVRSDGRIEVTAGLAEGDLVVVEGYQNLADGQHVTIVQ
jgi:membrane fusion protein, multidrug efflux system